MTVETPQPQGSETPPETPADEVATSDVNWADMSADTDDDAGQTVEGEFAVDESGDTPPEALPPETPETVVAPEAPTEPVTPAPAEPVAAVQPTPPVPAAPEPTPAQAPVSALDYDSWKTHHLSGLEKHYALDADTAQALLTEPETVLPRLAAQVHFEVTENVLKAVHEMMPGMLAQINQSKEVESKAENAFFEKNPDLKGIDKAKILQIGAMFRQVNPTADADTTITTIGNMVRTALGLPPGGSAQSNVPPPASPPVVQPFAPVRGGGSGTAPRVAAQTNPWAELIDGDD